MYRYWSKWYLWLVKHWSKPKINQPISIIYIYIYMYAYLVKSPLKLGHGRVITSYVNNGCNQSPNSYPTLLWYRWVFFVCIFHWYFTMSNIFIINITFSSEFWIYMFMSVWRICRRLWHRGLSLWQPARRRRLWDRYYMTMLFPVFNKSSTSLRRNCCRFGGVFVAGCTGNCHAGNFHCGRLRKLRRNCDFIRFSFWGITSELFDEFAYWFLNYQPSFYHCTAILLSILFHSILFPCISFQILFFWILFLLWDIYIYHCFYHLFNVPLHVCFMYHYLVPLFICIYVYLFIYLFIESRGLATWWC